MRKVIALLLVLVFAGTAQALQYPELGVCTGDSVRLRDSPGTKSKIVGKINAGRQFIIIGETEYKGQTWYMVDHPTKKGSAYILAKYVNGFYFKNDGFIPVGPIFSEVRLRLGISPEKARIFFGRPSETKKVDEFTELKYPGCDLQYEFGNLTYAHVTKKGYPVAGVEVGDSAKKLLVFGMPEDHIVDLTAEEAKNWDAEEDGPIGYEGWSFESSTGESLFFEFDYSGGEMTIDSITWSSPRGEG